MYWFWILAAVVLGCALIYLARNGFNHHRNLHADRQRVNSLRAEGIMLVLAGMLFGGSLVSLL